MPSFIKKYDPEEEYRTRNIRYSRSRDSKTPFKLIEKPRAKNSKNLTIAIAVSAGVCVLAVVAIIIFTNKQEQSNQNINPAGNELTELDNTNAADVEQQRTDEQNKLRSLVDIVAEEDWAYAYAVWVTVFPDYLSDCERHEYYLATAALSDHIESFPLAKEECEAKADVFYKKCWGK